MAERPRLLDLFCGGGGAAQGYYQAGFEVVGVDIVPQPRYPFAWFQQDALEALRNIGQDFDAIHASPPCQSYSAMNRAVQGESPRLIAAVREMLRKTGKPYAIENVEGAWSEMEPPLITLCGTHFGLRVRRHRLFEVWPIPVFYQPPLSCTCRHGVRDGRLVGQMLSGKVAPGRTPRVGYTESDRREAIGVPWMTTMEARQAVPPAYTEFVGKMLLLAITQGG